MAKEMENLRDRIISINLDRRKKFFLDRDVKGFECFIVNFAIYSNLIETTSKHSSCISCLLKRLYKSKTLSGKEMVLLTLFQYLLVAEGVIANFLNYLSYLLVTTGHDLFSLTKRQYIEADVEDIRKVEMSTKIKFLNYHGFGALTKEYDSNFRNDIAHHNYKIDERGVLRIRGKPVKLDYKLNSIIKIQEFIVATERELNRKLENQTKELEKEIKEFGK